ncbi:MAG: ABC transporter ATP-binding protein [Ruminococcaceae bacterium]|nr:ABC transporter ATP-binding protein [Oscillospiraceae bacterium]
MAKMFSAKKNSRLISPRRTEVRRKLKSMVPQGVKPVAISEYNLSFEQEFIYGALALTDDKLYLFDEAVGERVLDVSALKDIKTVQYVGCVAVEYGEGEDKAELCRSDMSNSENLRRFVKRASAINDGRKFDRSTPEKQTRCPNCGKPYRQGSSKCEMCTDKKNMYARLLKYVKPHILPLLLAVVLYFAGSGLGVLAPALQKKLVDGYIMSGKPFGEISRGFYSLVALMVIVALSEVIFLVIRRILVAKVGNKIAVTLRGLVFDSIPAMSVGDISRRSSGELITRVTSDTQVLKEFLISLVPEIFQYGTLMLAIITILFIINWKLAVFVILPVPFILVVHRMSRRYTHKLYHQQWHANSEVNTVLHDVFSGIRVVKVFGTEKAELERFDKAIKKERDIAFRNELFWNLLIPTVDFLMRVGEYAVLLISGSLVLSGALTMGSVQQLISYAAMIYQPLRWLSNVPRRLTRSATSMAKVFEIIDEEPEVKESEKPVEKEIHGDIRIERGFFGYNNLDYVLKDVSLEIKKGDMIGIVGRSGVGKSTLINLVMRLYDLDEGTLLIDGIPIQNYSQRCLRSQIGVVLQESFMFKGTIAENILYGAEDADPDKLIRAAKSGGAHSFIMGKPDGYDTYVSERGSSLSGGEKQRVQIARAVLRNPKILILDEATASLDTETEKQIQDSIAALTKERTTLAIAHRLSTLRNATRLIVLEKGTVEEEGTHDELMRNGGRYYKLVMAQRSTSKLQNKAERTEAK